MLPLDSLIHLGNYGAHDVRDVERLLPCARVSLMGRGTSDFQGEGLFLFAGLA